MNYTGSSLGAPPKDAFDAGVQHTQQPIVTGSSVLGITYKDGVLLAADTLVTAGSVLRYSNVDRVVKINDQTALAASGDFSDLQRVLKTVTRFVREDKLADGTVTQPSQVYSYLTNVMYGRRSKLDPLWNAILVAGWENDAPFLGYVDLLGVTYSAPSLATGFGHHLAQPMLRNALDSRPDGAASLSEEEAVAVLRDALKVLYYRDTRALNKFKFARVTANGVQVSEPQSVDTQWEFARYLRGYGNSNEVVPV